MDAVVVLHDPTRTRHCGTDAHLYSKELYFELVIVVVFEDEGSWPGLMHQVKFVLIGYGDHLSY
mgnify:CR=1 FL=1